MDHSRYRWIISESGNVMNENRYTTTPHCLEIPDKDNPRSKQQIFLSPCDETNEAQHFALKDGLLRVKSNDLVCVMWNLYDKTRLWGYPCNEHVFAELEAEVVTTEAPTTTAAPTTTQAPTTTTTTEAPTTTTMGLNRSISPFFNCFRPFSTVFVFFHRCRIYFTVFHFFHAFS